MSHGPLNLFGDTDFSFIRMRFTVMAVVEIAGAQVAYRVEGQGPGLVVVHGTGGDSQSHWGHLVEHFSSQWTVVRPDYSGSGATVDDGQPLSVEILAAQVVGAARAAGAVPFDLVGFSLGASLATYIAAEYPAEVRSVAVLAGFASGRNSRFKLQFGLWRDLIGGDVGALAKLMVLTGMSPRLPDEPDLRPGCGNRRGDRRWYAVARHAASGRIGRISGRVGERPAHRQACTGHRLQP